MCVLAIYRLVITSEYYQPVGTQWEPSWTRLPASRYSPRVPATGGVCQIGRKSLIGTSQPFPLDLVVIALASSDHHLCITYHDTPDDARAHTSDRTQSPPVRTCQDPLHYPSAFEHYHVGATVVLGSGAVNSR